MSKHNTQRILITGSKGFIGKNLSLRLTDELGIEVLSFKNYDEKTRYYILRRKVLKVYPYAIYTKNKLLEIEKDIESPETEEAPAEDGDDEEDEEEDEDE